MKTLTMLFSFLIGSMASAEPPLCSDWPTVIAQSGPRLAVTDYPFNLNLRLSCLLGKRYMIEGLVGSYQSGRNLQIPPYLALVTHALPTGDMLYQFFHVIPRNQEPGIYAFRGCVMILEMGKAESRCLPVSHQLEVVEKF